jgi:hypothetical protein
LAAGVLYLLLRLPHLRNLAIFCDEAIYLRWAQLVRLHPAQNLFVSLNDAKPPLHIWLLALAWPLHVDPLVSGRLLSLACGLASIPVVFQFSSALAGSAPAPEGNHRARVLGPLLALLMITSPFLAFNERMALAEPLLALEAFLIAWFSLRLVYAAGAPETRLWQPALTLGLLMGAALLTKQFFGYFLCCLPPIAAGCFLLGRPRVGPGATGTHALRRWTLAFMLAGALAVVLFLPMLLAPGHSDLNTRLFYKSAFRAASAHADRWAQIRTNLATIFLPTTPTDQSTDAGWFWTYLTPPVYLVALLGLGWLAIRHQWRILFFLLAWSALFLMPLAIGGSIIYSRYALVGSLPLLIAAAWVVCDLAVLLGCLPIRQPIAGWALATLGVLALLAWPLFDLSRQWNWRTTHLTTADQRQYLTDWSAGFATQDAIAYLQAGAAKTPTVVVTTENMGDPGDALWVYLRDNPNILLVTARGIDQHPVLDPTPTGGCWLDLEKWRGDPLTDLHLPTGVPILLVARDPLLRPDHHFVRLMDLMPPYNPGARLLHAFLEPPERASGQVTNAVCIYLLPALTGSNSGPATVAPGTLPQ